MKKLLLSMTALLMIGLSANAQPWSFGPKAGIAFSTVNGFEGARVRTGLVAGAFAERMVKNWFAVQTELLFVMQGHDVKNPDAPKTKMRLNYMAMPVITKYYVLGGLNFQLGGQFQYLVSGKEVYDGVKTNLKDNINKYNVGFITGLAYDLDCGLVVEGRYCIGLTKVYNIPDSSITSGSLQVALGWKF